MCILPPRRGTSTYSLAVMSFYCVAESAKKKLTWLSFHWNSNSFVGCLKRLVFAVFAYQVHRVRNAAVFKQVLATAIGVLNANISYAQNAVLCSGKVPRNQENWHLALK